jgi:pimeloyl-ACP methyl ester carboxylesterase
MKSQTLSCEQSGISFEVSHAQIGKQSTVVWIHGEFGSFEDPPFSKEVQALANIVVVHLPGWGKSTSSSEICGDTPVFLTGHGLGATIAVEMAIQQPRLTLGLLLAAPFGFFDESDPGVDIFALMPKDLMKHLYENPNSDLAQTQFPSSDDGYERGLIAIRRVEVLGSASRYLFPIPDTNIGDRAYRLSKVPMSVLFGKSDGVVPSGLSAQWAKSFPHAEIQIIPEAGHMLPYETTATDRALEKLLAVKSGS